MEIKENHKAMERKHFLMRALDKKTITQEQYDKEINILNNKIQENLFRVIKEKEQDLKSEIVQVKKVVTTDGNLKRSIANILIKFLEKDFNNDEIKGIFRQGYKLMRLK